MSYKLRFNKDGKLDTRGRRQLKPCPFCRGKATTAKTHIPKTGFMTYYVGCYSQNCLINPCANIQNSELPDVGWNKSVRFMTKRLRAEAIKAWNRRPK